VSLALTSVQTRSQSDEIPVFNSWVPACCHVCDHVLTEPEAWSWTELLTEPPLDLRDPNACFKLAKKAWRPKEDGAPLQSLYDGYANEISMALQSKFWVQDGWQRKHLSIRGVAAVTSDRQGVHSAYLPGLGSNIQTSNAQALEWDMSESEIRDSRKRNPLPRQVRRHDAEDEPPTSPTEDEEVAALRRYRLFLGGADWLSLEAFHLSQSAFLTPDTAMEDAIEELSDAQREFVLWEKLEDSARGAK
jgi:hypothetical protein